MLFIHPPRVTPLEGTLNVEKKIAFLLLTHFVLGHSAKRTCKQKNMTPGGIYHVFNHANGFEKLYREEDDFEMFMQKFRKQTSPFLDILAFCLMTNHYHILIHVKELSHFESHYPNKDPEKVTSKAFSNAFNGYAQCFNRKYGRMGSLFMQNMKSKFVDTEIYFCKVVHYIHANPVHHGFTPKMEDWRHSSYPTYLKNKRSWMDTEFTLLHFGGHRSFCKYHQQPIGLKQPNL